MSAGLPTVLTPDLLKEFLSRLIDPAKTAVLLGTVTGLRAGELLGLKWSDIDFEKLEIRLIRDVVKQRIERCKTEASKKPIPIDAALAEALWSWRLQCAYNQEDDWVFASNQVSGRLYLYCLRQYDCNLSATRCCGLEPASSVAKSALDQESFRYDLRTR